MWVRKVLIALLLALFVLSISGVANAVLRGPRVVLSNDPRTNDVDPWGETMHAGENSGPTSSIKTTSTNQAINSCNLIIIGNMSVGVIKVEVKNQMPSFEAKKGK